MSSAGSPSRVRSRRVGTPWAVLAGMLMLGVIAAEYVYWTAFAAEQQRYRYSVDSTSHAIRDAIRDRIDTYISLLRGAAGLFAADGTVTREQFHEYANRLDLPHNYGGVMGLGYLQRIPPGQAEAVERDQQQGNKPFRVWTAPDGRETYVTLYLEPRDEEKQAAGYDILGQSVLREAMDRARDTGHSAASAKVALRPVKSAATQPSSEGFLIFVPVYRGGVDPGNLAARRVNLLGFIYCPFRVSDLLAGIGGDPQLAGIHFTVYDGPVPGDEHHLHQTGPDGPQHRDSASAEPSAQLTLDVAGRIWTVSFHATPQILPQPSRALPLAVLGTAFVFGMALFFVMSSQARSRNAAEAALAELGRSQAALHQSEASLRRLVESNLIGVVIADVHGVLLEANDTFLSITGYTREDLMEGKLNWATLTPPDYAEQYRTAQQQLATGGTQPPTEKQYIRKDGSRVPVLVGTTALEGDRRAGVSFVVDLTERRKAQAAVAENDRRFRTVVEQSPLGIQIFASDGHVLLANRAWERTWGSDLRVLQGYNVLQDLQLDKIGLTPYLIQAFAGEAAVVPPLRYDPALSGRPGRPRWVQFYLYPLKDRAGQVNEVVLILHDLTEVKEAEQALHRSEEQLRLVIDALPVLIGYIDQDKQFRLNNELFEEWFDRPVAEIEGRPVRDLLGDDSFKLAEPHIDRALAGERTSYDRQMVFPDGGMRDLHVTLIPHVGLAGHVEGVVALVADVTERIQAETERSRLLAREQEARADAETANRIKDEFLATLSHELRTPLNAILGWAQLLRMGGLPPDEVVHGLEAIERNAKVQAQLVEDLLDLSRIISGKLRLEMRAVDLPTVLDAALDSVRPAAEAKGIQLLPLLDASASPVLGDAGRLQQVIWNLLSNAIKFTPPRGKVELLLQRMDGHAEILVSDTGIGISPDFLPYVFDRLRQADSSSTRRHGGLGLGLAIARHLIESHGGTIRVHSAGENRGATFTISLPLSLNAVVKDALPGNSGSQTTLAPGARKLDGVRVLVVDDEADARDLVSRVLRQDGAEVRSASSAAEALGAVDELNPDVLVSDIAMPGEDGYDLIRQLRSRERSHGGRLPAIALTAFARKEDRERALREGFQTHLAKPVEPVQLSQAVAELARH